MSFDELQLIPPILKALKEEGYTTPTPIQSQAIPIILKGKDLLGCAQTGTGKTAAFAIPILQLLHENNKGPKDIKRIRALILTPTRELAIQIKESFDAYGKHLRLKNLVIFGGVNQGPQVSSLKRGIDILVAGNRRWCTARKTNRNFKKRCRHISRNTWTFVGFNSTTFCKIKRHRIFRIG